jgi:hypothetical protein
MINQRGKAGPELMQKIFAELHPMVGPPVSVRTSRRELDVEQ